MVDTHVEMLAVVVERRRKLQEIKGLKTNKATQRWCSVAVSVVPELTVLYSGVSSEGFPYFQRCFSISFLIFFYSRNEREKI